MSHLESTLRAFVTAAAADTRLPSTRSLVAEHAVSPITVQRVIRRLVAEGLVQTRPGSGNYVLRRPSVQRADFSWQTTVLGASTPVEDPAVPMLDAPSEAIALHNAYPAEDLLPARLVRSALARVSRTTVATERSPAAGVKQLRQWFAAEVTPGPGANPPTADDVLVIPGGQSGLSSIFRGLGEPGDAIVMESPTYWGAIAAARQAGLRIVPVARQGAAPDPADLDFAFRSSGAKLFYAQPHFANPTGALWTAAEATAVLDVVRAHRAYLIEDDWAHDFAIDAPVHTLVQDDLNGHVIYVRSLTKSVSPALRVAAIIARGPAFDRIRARRTVDDLYVSGLLQAAALDVVSDPGWPGHLRRMQTMLRDRRDAMAAAVHEHLGPAALPELPRGGLNLWVRLPDDTDVNLLGLQAQGAGVYLVPGTVWFPTEPNGAFVRLTFSGPRPDRYPDALRILATLLR